MLRSSLFMLLVLANNAVGSIRLPLPLEAADCSVAAPFNELPDAQFERKGGRRTASKVLFQRGVLTVNDVAQGRVLGQYEQLTVVNPKPMTVVEMKDDLVLARARTFLWQHWRDHKQAYLRITLSGVDATSTSHVFVEHDNAGRWRVSWRIVRHIGRVDDLPTYYSMEWVTPAGFRKPGKDLPEGQEPDPIKNRLEFRDKCGDVEHSL